jgi:hypothetical protein
MVCKGYGKLYRDYTRLPVENGRRQGCCELFSSSLGKEVQAKRERRFHPWILVSVLMQIWKFKRKPQLPTSCHIEQGLPCRCNSACRSSDEMSLTQEETLRLVVTLRKLTTSGQSSCIKIGVWPRSNIDRDTEWHDIGAIQHSHFRVTRDD